MSGDEEDSDFYRREEKCCVTICRDDLNSIYGLTQVCIMALTNPEWKGQENCQIWVAGVLCDFVAPKVNQLSEDLKTI
jgi:hypothetical protein